MQSLLDLKQDFDDLNAILEVCRGYTEIDAPDVDALNTTLYILHTCYSALADRIEVRGNA